jgi:hypothetical protein
LGVVLRGRGASRPDLTEVFVAGALRIATNWIPSDEALMTRTAVSVQLIADTAVALIDHARAERPGLDQV